MISRILRFLFDKNPAIHRARRKRKLSKVQKEILVEHSDFYKQLNQRYQRFFEHRLSTFIQTYEFAHPENKKLTGPLQNFTRMIQSDNYSILLNHEKTKVGVIHQDQFHEVYLIQVTKGKKSENFLWTLITYIDENKNAFWYTVNVIPYSKVST